MDDSDALSAPGNPYELATRKLLQEGFRFNSHCTTFDRGDERVKLRWNGRVYARRKWPVIRSAYDVRPV
jgi:hypothetical protein